MSSPVAELEPLARPEPVSEAIGEKSTGGLPGEGPLRIDLYKVPSDTPRKVKLLRALWGDRKSVV